MAVVVLGASLVLLASCPAYGVRMGCPHPSFDIDERAWEKRRLRTAMFVVSTVGRRLPSQSEVQLTSFEIAKLPEHDRRALLEYSARRLATRPETEGLLAFVDDGIPPEAQAEIAATVPATVRPLRWAPPGSQPIPMYIGNEAHRAIAAYYRAAHGQEVVRLNIWPIATILKRFARMGVGPATNLKAKAIGDLALRPDIVNLTTREVYEIKRAAGGLKAPKQSFASVRFTPAVTSRSTGAFTASKRGCEITSCATQTSRRTLGPCPPPIRMKGRICAWLDNESSSF